MDFHNSMKAIVKQYLDEEISISQLSAWGADIFRQAFNDERLFSICNICYYPFIQTIQHAHFELGWGQITQEDIQHIYQILDGKKQYSFVTSIKLPDYRRNESVTKCKRKHISLALLAIDCLKNHSDLSGSSKCDKLSVLLNKIQAQSFEEAEIIADKIISYILSSIQENYNIYDNSIEFRCKTKKRFGEDVEISEKQFAEKMVRSLEVFLGLRPFDAHITFIDAQPNISFFF